MSETEILTFFIRGNPMPQPRPRGRVMFIGGKPQVHIYDKLEQYEDTPKGARRIRKQWDAAKWRDRIIERTRAAAAATPGLPIEGPVRLDLDIYFPRPGYMLERKYPATSIWHVGRPDVDNLFKLIADAITQAGWRESNGATIKTPIVWNDDAQVCDSIIRKRYVARGEAEGVMVMVTRLMDPEPPLFELPTTNRFHADARVNVTRVQKAALLLGDGR